MACGTPVIAFNRGSVPEIVEDGLTGFVVGDEEEAVAATDGLSRLSRGAIRQRFEERFTARRMAREYLVVYRSLIELEALRDRASTSYRSVHRDSRPHPQSRPRRIPSSRVLAEVIHQASAEYVTVGWLTSTLHRPSFGIIMLSLGLLGDDTGVLHYSRAHPRCHGSAVDCWPRRTCFPSFRHDATLAD